MNEAVVLFSQSWSHLAEGGKPKKRPGGGSQFSAYALKPTVQLGPGTGLLDGSLGGGRVSMVRFKMPGSRSNRSKRGGESESHVDTTSYDDEPIDHDELFDVFSSSIYK